MRPVVPMRGRVSPTSSSAHWSSLAMKTRKKRRGPAAHEVPVVVRRGDVIWIDCDPTIGVEPRKTRTCVVVSNDIANQHGAAITVVPTQQYTAERAGRAYMVDLRQPRSTL